MSPSTTRKRPNLKPTTSPNCDLYYPNTMAMTVLKQEREKNLRSREVGGHHQWWWWRWLSMSKLGKECLRRFGSGVSYIQMEKNWACFICLFGLERRRSIISVNSFLGFVILIAKLWNNFTLTMANNCLRLDKCIFLFNILWTQNKKLNERNLVYFIFL